MAAKECTGTRDKCVIDDDDDKKTPHTLHARHVNSSGGVIRHTLGLQNDAETARFLQYITLGIIDYWYGRLGDGDVANICVNVIPTVVWW